MSLPICYTPTSTLFPYTTLFRSLLRPIRFSPQDNCHQLRKTSTPLWELGRFLPRTETQYCGRRSAHTTRYTEPRVSVYRSEEHTSELQSLRHLVCRLLLAKDKNA